MNARLDEITKMEIMSYGAKMKNEEISCWEDTIVIVRVVVNVS